MKTESIGMEKEWGQIKKAPDGAYPAIKRRKNRPFFKNLPFFIIKLIINVNGASGDLSAGCAV